MREHKFRMYPAQFHSMKNEQIHWSMTMNGHFELYYVLQDWASISALTSQNIV